jgi:lysophospholipase L1-like esterase
MTTHFAAIVFSAATVLATGAGAQDHGKHWIGTWSASSQTPVPGTEQTFRGQSVRLIVHTSAGGKKVRIRISNTYGDRPLLIGGAHIARRAGGADIDPASDRILKFHGQAPAKIPARAFVVSDAVDLDVAALSDLAISLFLPESTLASTMHVVAKQTNYVADGDRTADVKFPVAKTIRSWPFLTGVDVEASARGAAIVAFGSSLTDGDGSTIDTNRRWPDLLAGRLQEAAGGKSELGVLNQGLIGNRLLADSPGGQYGAALGQAGLARFDRDVLSQTGVHWVVVGLGINDIAFPGALTSATARVSAGDLISGYRQLIARAHKKGVRVIGTTNSPFEEGFLTSPPVKFYTPEKELVRKEVNTWILNSGEFDGVIDFDAVVRDPGRPERLLPEYDSGDHIHPNNAGYTASANAIRLSLFDR